MANGTATDECRQTLCYCYGQRKLPLCPVEKYPTLSARKAVIQVSLIQLTFTTMFYTNKLKFRMVYFVCGAEEQRFRIPQGQNYWS